MALVDGTVETERDLIKLLEFCKKTMRPMVIVAHDFSSEALTAMVVNRL
jgi:chaperonin GroEL (HSP60 family)